MNKKFVSGVMALLAIIAGAVFVNSASAQETTESAAPANSLLIEDFNYPAGSLLTANGWTAHSGAGTNPIATSTPGLTLSGYPSSGVGNAVSLTTSGEDVNRTFATQTSGSVYAAFLVNVSDASTDPAGGYFFHLGPDPIGTTFRARVFIKKDASNNIAFGISKAATTATDVVFTPFSYSLNTTYLLVVKYTIVDGASNDTVSLFVGTTVPANEPAPTISATDIATQSDINPGSVALRQGATATSPTVRVDGIRIGTTWASVTQPVAPRDAPVDFNGDGRSDWVVARNVSGQLTWFIQNNGAAGSSVTPFGVPTDRAVPEDYDGDGKDDIAVWRETGNPVPNRSYFYILRSTNNTVQIEQFGTTGDNPMIVGDYDGDGKADVAVFRQSDAVNMACGANTSIWLYRPSGTAGVDFRYECWGRAGDFPAPGDFDGDGRNDYAVHRNEGGSGIFFLKNSGGTTETVFFGQGTDVYIPGDYDGDGKSDFAVRRTVSGAYHHFILTRMGGGTGAAPIVWGATGDISTPGDYDGDGRTDIAVFRPNSDPTQNFFFVRQSSNSALLAFEWGQQGDTAPASFQVR